MHVGPLLVRPSLTTRIEADSNALNRSADKRGDVFVVFAPAVEATHEGRGSRLALRADAAVARFAKLTRLNHETFGVEANGSLAVVRRTSLFARASYDRRVEPIGSAGEAQVEGSRARYDEAEAQLAVRHEGANTRVTAAVTATRRSYADIERTAGGKADQSFRDTSSVLVSGKIEHAIPAGATLFAQGSYGWIDNRHASPCCDRSSRGGQVLAGFSADQSKLVTAELGAGYVFRNFDSPQFEDFGGLAWRARLNWYPTPLISFAASSDRTVANSGIVTSSAVLVDTLQLQGFYEVRRNFVAALTLARTGEEFRDIDAEAETFLIGLEGRYVFSSQYTSGGFVRYRRRSADGTVQLREGDAFEAGMWLRVAM